MIIQHKVNVAAFASAHYSFWPVQPVRQQVITATTAAAPPSGPVPGSLGLMGVGI